MSITSELSYVTSDMLLEITYNPSFLSHDRPTPPLHNTTSQSWIGALFRWSINSLKKSEDHHLITTTIQSEYYFSGVITVEAEIVESYPFLGNATVYHPQFLLILIDIFRFISTIFFNCFSTWRN